MLRTLLTVFLSYLSLSCATTNAAAGAPTVDVGRSVVIGGVIQNGNIMHIGGQMIDWAKQSKDPIDLIISSPGGDVVTGFLFINQMEAVKAEGVKIRCFVPTMAASMAFQIFVHCDERYALSKAFLLWHRVRVSLGGGLLSGGSTVTAPMAKDLYLDMSRLDRLIFTETNNALDMPTHAVRYHFEKETLHVASQLEEADPGFVHTFPAIPGLIDALLKSQSRASDRFGRAVQFKEGQIVYIYTP